MPRSIYPNYSQPHRPSRQPAVAYNNNTFIQHQAPNKSLVNKNPIVEQSFPVTITWNVSAYVEEEKENFLKRCFKRKPKENKPPDNKVRQYNQYGMPMAPPQPVQPADDNQRKIKHILKQGNFDIKRNQYIMCKIMLLNTQLSVSNIKLRAL
jgi:hypothetical protein